MLFRSGVPEGVIERAKVILSKLEINDINHNINNIQGQVNTAEFTPVNTSNVISDGLFHYMNKLEVEHMTPIEAMNALYKIMEQFKANHK